jgi:hypothetical protein
MRRRPVLRPVLSLIAAVVTMMIAGCVVVPYDGDHGYDGHHWRDGDREPPHWHERRWH